MVVYRSLKELLVRARLLLSLVRGFGICWVILEDENGIMTVGGGRGLRCGCIIAGLMQRDCCWVLFRFEGGIRPWNLLRLPLRRWCRRVFLKRESPLQTDVHFLETRAEFSRERESSFRSTISAISKGKLDMKSTSPLLAPMELMSLANESIILLLAKATAEWCSSVGSSVYIH